MLSALVQSQAAILAIVISLTLIAVQLTASTYSPRVISLFRDSYGWQALFVFYGISIFYGLLVLKMIKGADDLSDDLSQITYLKISLEGHISTAYALGCLTFVMLIRYLQSVINFLNPASIIKRLAIKITKDKILNSEEDPIQPIMDIVHGSIMKYDLETTRVGLKAVTEQVTKIIDSDIDEKISGLFCNHLMRVNGLAISKRDEESTLEVIESLCYFAKATAEKELEMATNKAIYHLGLVGAIGTKNRFIGAAMTAACYLEYAGKVVTEKKIDAAAQQVAEALKHVGEDAAKMGFEDVVEQVVGSLGVVGVAAAEKKLDRATRQAVQCLGFVGTFAATKEFKNATHDAALYLGLIGKSAAKKGLEIATLRAAKYLAELTILSEETATQAIRKCEYELEDEDDEPFQKFIKIYEQELEKLRAEK